MYNFNLHIPTRIHFGKGTISYLSELKNYGKKVLLVYGGGSIKKNGIYDTAMEFLKSVDIEVIELVKQTCDLEVIIKFTVCNFLKLMRNSCTLKTEYHILSI